jgi:HK97 family phage major capsid protein
VNHRTYELNQLVGRVVNVRLDNKRLVGELRFSEANPEAAVVRGMVDEGTVTDMSLSAEPLRILRIQGEDGKTEVVKWTRWRPVEASIAGVGHDQSVGIGRALEDLSTAEPAITKEDSEMSDAAAVAEANTAEEGKGKENEAQGRIERGRQELDENFAVEQEERRKKAIQNLAKANQIGEDTAQAWIQRGCSLERVADDILKIHEERGKHQPQSVSALGLSDREAQQYSICRAIVAAHSGEWKKAGFELECHEEVAKRLPDKIPEKGAFFVPLEVQRRRTPVDLNHLMERVGIERALGIQRDLSTATLGAGGALVQTSVMGFDELLRNIAVLFRMGAQRLSGLRDNVTIPRQSASATAEWLGTETASPTETQQAFVQLALSPKTVSAYTELSRKLLLQASLDVEGLVNMDLAIVAALAADVAGLRGTGAGGQPLGLDNVTGVGSVSGSSLGFAGILEFQTDVATANVMPIRGGYVTTPAVASEMIQEVKYADTASPLWEGNIWTGTMQGFPAMSSNQVDDAVMYFGDWSKMVVAEWGVLEVETHPYANFPAGIIGVRVMYSMDVGVRYPAAFSRADTIT